MKRQGKLAVLVIALPVVVYGLCFATLLLARWLEFRSQECRVAPLMFHAVVEDRRRSSRFWMTISEFRQQMEQLKAAGVVTLSPDSLAAMSRRRGVGCPYPPNAVLITFDAEVPSHHRALVVPVLVALGYQAVFFVPSSFLDHPSAMSASDLLASAQAGMVIGSHSEYHRDMRLEDPDSMVASLRRSIARLSAVSGQEVRAVSAPGGRYNQTVVSGVRSSGATSFFTSDPCYITQADFTGPLCRIEIRGNGGMTALDAVREPWAVAVQAAEWGIKRGVEDLIGPRLWSLLHFLRSETGGPGY